MTSHSFGCCYRYRLTYFCFIFFSRMKSAWSRPIKFIWPRQSIWWRVSRFLRRSSCFWRSFSFITRRTPTTAVYLSASSKQTSVIRHARVPPRVSIMKRFNNIMYYMCMYNKYINGGNLAFSRQKTLKKNPRPVDSRLNITDTLAWFLI